MQERKRLKDPRLSALFNTASELIELIDMENGHLDNRRPERLSETEARKEGLVSDYRIKVTALRQAQAAGERFAEQDRDALRQVGERLERTMAGHARRVVRLKSITEGLVQSISEQANRGQKQVDGYGASGRGATVTMARNSYQRPTALSVNRTI
jgi:hypothetical protein